MWRLPPCACQHRDDAERICFSAVRQASARRLLSSLCGTTNSPNTDVRQCCEKKSESWRRSATLQAEPWVTLIFEVVFPLGHLNNTADICLLGCILKRSVMLILFYFNDCPQLKRSLGVRRAPGTPWWERRSPRWSPSARRDDLET